MDELIKKSEISHNKGKIEEMAYDHGEIEKKLSDQGEIMVKLPLTEETVKALKAGDKVLLSGSLLTARDAAHKKLVEALQQEIPLPVELRDQTIYYVGACPAALGEVMGPAGPTTSGRMDSYTPQLIEKGLRGMIGKGHRSEAVIDAMKEHKAVYFAAIGGAALLMGESIKSVEVLAYEELGTESLKRIQVENMPLIVVTDSEGNDLYSSEPKKFQRD